MESIRTNCFHVTAAPRIVVKIFTFSDGYNVPAGERVGIHQQGIRYNGYIYPNLEVFLPERNKSTLKKPTDVGSEWPVWGLGKIAW
jgi:hypothetical protein